MKFLLYTLVIALCFVSLKAFDYPVKTPGYQWSINQLSQSEESQLFLDNLDPVSDYSIYGWTQVDPQNELTQHSWIFFFRLTQHPDNTVHNLQKPGDRTLACWWSSDNRLHYTGYTTGNNNLWTNSSIQIPVEDLVEGPFFTYFGYSSVENSVFVYLKTSNGNVYSHKRGGYFQNPTTYLGAYIGTDYNETGYYPALDATYENWYVSGGPDAWVGNDEDMEDFINNINIGCATVYSECDYQGESALICDENTEIPFQVKSAKIPEGCYISLWQESRYNGNVVDFNEDFDCVENILSQFIEDYCKRENFLRCPNCSYLGGLFEQL